MHKDVQLFLKNTREIYPNMFIFKNVLDFGSYHVNGNNRWMFPLCHYTGIDLMDGRNVDVVSFAHEYRPTKKADTVVSTEMLEHDMFWKLSVYNMIQCLKPGGLLIITCATDPRPEHGTHDNDPDASPGTVDYYHNIGKKEFEEVIKPYFNDYLLMTSNKGDLLFNGIRL